METAGPVSVLQGSRANSLVQWEKLGKIFNPADHELSEGCKEFAKAPQAVVFEDFVRVYFCSQKKTSNGKYITVPQFADFSKAFDNVLRVSKQRPVICLGGLGHFDEHGIFPFNVLRAKGRFYAYTSGWSRRQSVSIDMAIGLAFSDDGICFEKFGLGGPVMSANVNEANLIGDPFVLFRGGKFHMWYIYGDAWRKSRNAAHPERVYKIAYAVSEDGVNWERDGISIIPNKFADEAQAYPTVAFWRDTFHMYFCYRNIFDFRDNKKNSYRLGYASSADGLTWRRDDSSSGIDIAPCGWDSEMMCYPNIFECDGGLYLLYNGNEFGRHGFGIAKLKE